MHWHPRPLQPGWLRRTLFQSLRLCFRAPLETTVLYLFMPGCWLLSQEPPAIASFVNAWVITIVGTVLAHKTYEQLPWSRVGGLLFQCRYLVAIVTLVSVMQCLVMNATSLGQQWIALFQQKSPVNQYQTGFGQLWLFVCITGGLSWAWFRRRPEARDDAQPEWPNQSLISGFSLPLMLSTGLPWSEATRWSIQGIKQNMSGLLLIWCVMVLNLAATPLTSALALAWFYCVHREIFWGPDPLPERLRPSTKDLSCSP